MRCTVLMGLALLACGCGGENYPETYPVTGNVTYNGKPLEGANVALISSDPSIRSAGGMTDAQGNFSVQTYFDPQNQPAGAMPGEFVVTVSKLEKSTDSDGPTPEQMMSGQMRMVAPKSLLPKKYSDPKASGFAVTVPEGSPPPLQLDLKD